MKEEFPVKKGDQAIGYLDGSYAVWQREGQLFRVVFDSQNNAFTSPVRKDEIVRFLENPIPWKE